MNKNIFFERRYIIAVVSIIILCFLLNVFKNANVLVFGLYLIIYAYITFIFLVQERKSLLNIKSIFVTLYSIMIGLAPVFYCIKNKFASVNSIRNQYLMILIGYFSMVFFWNIINIYINKKFFNIKIIKKDKNQTRAFVFSIILISISLIANLIYILTNINYFFGENLEVGRIAALSSNGIIIVLSTFNLPGIALLYDYVIKTGKYKKLLIFVLIFNSILFLIRGSRTNIINMFIVILLIRNRYKKFVIKQIVIFGVVLLIVISASQMYRSRKSSEKISLITTLSNNLQTGSVNLKYIRNTFPSKHRFQYGYTYLINIFMMLPGDDLDFTLWLKEKAGLYFKGGGLTPTIIGEGYINFAYIGIITSMILVSIIGNWLNNQYFDKKMDVAWNAYLITKMLDIFRGGFANVEIGILVFIFLRVSYTYVYKRLYKYIIERIERKSWKRKKI